MSKEEEEDKLVALIDFDCPAAECGKNIVFDLLTLKENDAQVMCGECMQPYQFDNSFTRKLDQLRKMVLAVKEAEDIIDDCNVSITTVNGEVKLPYRLLLTRMNTLISLEIFDKVIDFNFRIEPLNSSIK
jgi:hypothetical protein